MMSSHDSMGLVFKCLSKGAVDFLVKPIRKNELKNLWQHVWRRCHSVCNIYALYNFQLANFQEIYSISAFMLHHVNFTISHCWENYSVSISLVVVGAKVAHKLKNL